MKIIIERTELLNILNHMQTVAQSKSSIPILSNILIVASGSKVSFNATDLDININESIQAQIEEDGSTTTHAATLLEATRKIVDGSQIKLELSNNQLILSSGKTIFNLHTLSPDEFPNIPGEEIINKIEIPSEDLLTLFSKTSFATSNDETRHYLCGVYLHNNNNNLCAVATDGHKLALANTPVESDISSLKGIIIPKKAIQIISKLLDETDDIVNLHISENKLTIKLMQISMSCKLIDGNFPDYQKIIPTNNDNKINVKIANLSSAVDRVSIVSGKTKGIKATINNGTMQLTSSNIESSSAFDEINIEYNGSPIEIGFNANYLLHIINLIASNDAILEINDENSPFLIKDPENSSYFYVLMPMRI